MSENYDGQQNGKILKMNRTNEVGRSPLLHCKKKRQKYRNICYNYMHPNFHILFCKIQHDFGRFCSKISKIEAFVAVKF